MLPKLSVKKTLSPDELVIFEKLSIDDQLYRESKYRESKLSWYEMIVCNGFAWDDNNETGIDPFTYFTLFCNYREETARKMIACAEKKILKLFPDNEDWD